MTPTILYLCGIPVGGDMSGRPFLWALDPEFVARYPLAFVATHDTGTRLAAKVERSGELDQEHLDRLRGLGYLK